MGEGIGWLGVGVGGVIDGVGGTKVGEGETEGSTDGEGAAQLTVIKTIESSQYLILSRRYGRPDPPLHRAGGGVERHPRSLPG